MLPHLIKFAALLCLAVAVTALPASSDKVAASCESIYARCLHKNDANLCRDLVCSSFGEECLPCHSSLTTFTPALKPTNVAVTHLQDRALKPPPRNHCIIICAHAYCRPICTMPGKPPGSADTLETPTTTNATDLLAATNAQPDTLGLPFKAGTNTIVLGQKGEQKCAWLCSVETLTCEEKCWAPENGEAATVANGGELAQGEHVDGLTECQVVEKGEVGRVVVCNVPHADDGDSTGEGMNWKNTRCILFWRGSEPQVVCHGV